MKLIFISLLFGLFAKASTPGFISGIYTDTKAKCRIEVVSDERTGTSRFIIFENNKKKFNVDFDVNQKKGKISYCQKHRLKAAYFLYGNIAAVACADQNIEISALTYLTATRIPQVFKFSWTREGKTLETLICENLR